jgi:hypothetical protein
VSTEAKEDHDHHMLAAETLAGKHAPTGSVGEICDRTAETKGY